MKTLHLILLILLAMPLIGFATPTLDEVQSELALTQAKLALVEAKLTLAKRESEFATLSQATQPAEKPAGTVAGKPTLTPEQERDNLAFKRNQALFEEKSIEDKIALAQGSQDPDLRKELPALQSILTTQKVAVALAETTLNSYDKNQTFKKANDSDRSAAEHEAKASSVTADAVQGLIKDDLDQTLLRKYGFGINLGYGYLSKLKQTAPTVMVRYNFFHRLHETEEGARRHERTQRAEYRTMGREMLPRQKKFFGQQFNDVSGWIGYPAVKFDSLDGTAKESPLLVGLAIGLGHGPEYSSAVSIDMGVALFNNPKFKSTDFYLGVSTDVTVYKAIFKSMADAIK